MFFVGGTSLRLTNKGAEQICFTLMDRQRRRVSCIAHGVSISPEIFTEGKELVLFYAVGQAGLRNNPGSVWLYGDSYVLSLGSVPLPRGPIEDIRLLS